MQPHWGLWLRRAQCLSVFYISFFYMFLYFNHSQENNTQTMFTSAVVSVYIPLNKQTHATFRPGVCSTEKKVILFKLFNEITCGRLYYCCCVHSLPQLVAAIIGYMLCRGGSMLCSGFKCFLYQD